MESYGKIAPASSANIQICSISLNMTDRIRLIAVPQEMTNEIREAIVTGWGAIQDEREYIGCHEFKLNGNPWRAQSSDAVRSRKLLTSLLRAMAINGWNLLQAADVSKKLHDKDTLFFEYGNCDPEAQLFAVSFNMRDRIRLIDPPGPGFWSCIKEAVDTQWRFGIQDEREYCGAMELKLRGNPWFPNGDETVYGRLLLCQILANIRAQGFKLYGSIDINIGREGMDLETWVFRKVSPLWQ